MPYKLANTEWLALEVARVKSILSVQMVKDQEYTVAELLALLKTYGLDYSNPEYVEIGQELVTEGFLDST